MPKKKYKPVNPWAVCTKTVGRDDKAKYERCVTKVKKKHPIRKRAPKKSSLVAASPSKVALLEEDDMGKPGDFSTADLPQTGHEEAIDDGQQQYEASEPSMLIEAAKVLLKNGDKVLARRIHKIARDLGKAFAEAGIRDTEEFEPLSTADLPETGDDADMSGAPLDSDQQPRELPFYGTTPVDKGDAGPEPRGASKKPKGRTAKKTVAQAMIAPTWLEQKGFTMEDWKAAVTKAVEKGVHDPTQKPTGKDYGAAVAIMKNMKKKAPVEASAKPWNIFIKSLKKIANRGGKWGQGSWETTPEVFGRAADLNINTTLDDGSPLIATTVGFALAREGKTGRTAMVEVHDQALYHETTKVKINAKTAPKLAAVWAQRTENVAKSQLEG